MEKVTLVVFESQFKRLVSMLWGEMEFIRTNDELTEEARMEELIEVSDLSHSLMLQYIERKLNPNPTEP